MVRARVVLTFIAFSAMSANATQDLFAPIRTLSISATYRIAPDLLEMLPCWENQSCEYPTYAGTVQLDAETSESDGRLTKFEVQIDGDLVPLSLVEEFGNLTQFVLGGASIRHAPGYLPGPLREEIVGLGPPYLVISQFSATDTSCEFEWRWISIVYYFENGEVRIRQGCGTPD